MRWTLILALAVLSSPALAATTVIGNISHNTPTLNHWTVAGSPYNVTGDATVVPNTTLIIDPGVTVVVSSSDASMSGVDPNHVELVINGSLQINGTAASPVVISDVSAGAGNWVGFTLNTGSVASSITFLKISDAQTAIAVVTANAPTITDTTISAVNNGIVWQSAAAADLERMTITNFGTSGVSLADDGSSGLTATVNQSTVGSSAATSQAIAIATRVNATVTRNYLVMNGTAVAAAAGSSLTLENCVIAANAVAGVSVNQSGSNPFSIINNTIDQNFSASEGTGLQVLAVSNASNFIVRNNIVTNNGTGISVSGTTSPSMDSNDVWNNGGNSHNYTGTSAGAQSISVNPLFLNPAGTTPPGNAAWQSLVTSTLCEPNGAANLTCGNIEEAGAGWIQATVHAGPEESITIDDRNGVSAQTLSSSQNGTISVLGNSASIVAYCAYYDQDPNYYCAGNFAVSYLPLSFDYHVQASSPVIDTGNNLGAPSDDLDGAMRPYNATQTATATVDMGAYEYHTNIPPSAIQGMGQTVLVNTAVNFDGTASFDPDGTVVSWDWDFGDGANHGSGATATHTYVSTGMFTVTLVVTDNDGAMSAPSTVVENVVASLPPVAVPGNSQIITLGATVTLDGSASYQTNGTIVAYEWSFGDGTQDATTPVAMHTYQAVGNYTATLTVTSNYGAMASASVIIGVTTSTMMFPPPVANAGGPYTSMVGQSVAFDGSASTATQGTIMTFSWDFGDGNTGTGAIPMHTYTATGAFVVNLTVTDSHGGMDMASTLATISGPSNSPPVAVPGGPYTGMINMAVAFDGSGSSATNGTIASYSWNFGDGGSGNGVKPHHTYTAAGAYLVNLTVTDSGGGMATASALATISAPSNTPPVANPGGPYSGLVNQAVSFDGSGSTATGGTIASYSWDFGDGSTGTGVKPMHSYGAANSYLVTLTVTDSNGGSGNASTLAAITTPSHTPPSANAGGSKQGTVGVGIIFDASASMAASGSRIVSYAWDFGDGSNSTMETVSHTYTTAGSYIVTLTVTDDQNATGMDSVVASITSMTSNNHPPPVANAGSNVSANAGQTIDLSAAASTDADGTITVYQWDFGDGTTATGLSASHAYSMGGSYIVTLTVSDSFGNTGMTTVTATIFGLPVPNAGGNRQGTVGVAMPFDGSMSTVPQGMITTYAWTFGDGAVATGAMASHTYTQVGTFTVTLTLTDDKGGHASTTVVASITAAPTPPAASRPSGCSTGGEAGLMALLACFAMLRRRSQRLV